MSEKDTAFYSAAIQGWITSRMERDKSIFILSVLSIGYLVNKNPGNSFLYTCAISLLFASSMACIVIFGENAGYLAKVIQSTECNNISDKLLGWLDKFLLLSFFSGILITILIGLGYLG